MVNQGNTFNCEICSLEFTCKAIMDAHWAGSKHKRRIQGNELLLKLQQEESCFVQNEENGTFTCLVCFIELTSPQHLKAHLQGSEHKNKVDPSSADSTPADSKPVDSTPATPKTGGKKRPAKIVEPPPAKKRNPIPGTEKYFCDTCQISCNSDGQWDQHTNSKKHINKVAGLV